MYVYKRCPSYTEQNKGRKEVLGPTLGVSFRGVRLIESQIKGVKKGRDQLQVSVLVRCPCYRGVYQERIDYIPGIIFVPKHGTLNGDTSQLIL